METKTNDKNVVFVDNLVYGFSSRVFCNEDSIPLDMGIPSFDWTHCTQPIKFDCKFTSKEKQKLKHLTYWRIPRKAKKHIKKLLANHLKEDEKKIRIREYFDSILNVRPTK